MKNVNLLATAALLLSVASYAEEGQAKPILPVPQATEVVVEQASADKASHHFKATKGVKLLKKMQAVPARKIKYVNVLEVDPALVKIKAVSAKKLIGKSRMTIPAFMSANPTAIAAVNSSFFSVNDGMLVGFFMEDGKLGNFIPESKIEWVFYVTKDGRPDVYTDYQLPQEMQADVESATAGKSHWDIAADRTARSAVCITGQGKVKLINAYPVATIAEMASYLTEDEGCVKFVHFDGGGSSQFAYRPEGMTVGWERKTECYQEAYNVSPEQCHRPVAAYLAIFPK